MRDDCVIAITMGDPSGVGPEIILKTLNAWPLTGVCRPLVVGDLGVLEEAKQHLPITMHHPLKAVNGPDEDPGGAVGVLDMGNVPLEEYELGRPGQYTGRAVVEYVKKAVELAMSGGVSAIVTGPINKETLRQAGYPWPGHTELLAELTGATDYGMMLTDKKLRVILATIHCALRDVPGLVSAKRVLDTIRLAHRACAEMGIARPRLAVAGLNPHAGEGGIFGDEEILHIAPACEKASDEGMDVTGPLPPDTVFLRASRGEFDIVVAMYHDQGLIPLKLLGFKSAVNVTVGLPIIRTSVDHGTAYDIAGKGVAAPGSLIEAVKLAAEMAKNRATR